MDEKAAVQKEDDTAPNLVAQTEHNHSQVEEVSFVQS